MLASKGGFGGVPPRAIRMKEPSFCRMSHAGEVLYKWKVMGCPRGQFRLLLGGTLTYFIDGGSLKLLPFFWGVSQRAHSALSDSPIPVPCKLKRAKARKSAKCRQGACKATKRLIQPDCPRGHPAAEQGLHISSAYTGFRSLSAPRPSGRSPYARKFLRHKVRS